MKSLSRIILPLMLVFAVFVSTSVYGQDKDKKAIKKTIKAHWEALNAGDAAGYVGMFHPDGNISASSAGGFWAWDDPPTEEEFMENTKDTKFNFVPNHIAITLLDDKIALANYYLAGSIHSDDQKIDNYRTRVSQIWINEGGSWKVRHEHFSPLFGGAGVGG